MSNNPAELATLADQNAELLARLTDLEAESSRADSAGKRRLKALETEISSLRDELERVRSETERPSVLARNQMGVGGESVSGNSELLAELASDAQVLKMLKKLTREAKVRELKEKTRPWDTTEDTSEEPKNFAPGNFAPGMPFTSKWVARKSSIPSLTVETTLSRPPGLGISHSPPVSLSPSTPSSIITPTVASVSGTSHSPAKNSPSKNDREHALVSQLLLKIRELEETNSQLAANHVAARERLRNAQTETESVRQLCELISQSVDESMEFDLELELVNDGHDANVSDRPRFEMEFGGAVEESRNDRLSDLTDFQNRRPRTLRVRSVSRKASLDVVPQKHSLRVRRTASIDSFVTARSRDFEDPDEIEVEEDTNRRSTRERKTVLGLFDNISKDDLSLTLPGAMPKTPEPRKTSFGQVDLASPEKALEESRHEDDSAQLMSLGSELGLALHSMRPAPAHSRSKSILELFQGMESSLMTSPSNERAPSSSTSQTPARSTLTTGKTRTGVQRLMEQSDGLGVFENEKNDRPRLRRTSTQIPIRPNHSPSSTLTRSPPLSPPLARRLFASSSHTTLNSRTFPSEMPKQSIQSPDADSEPASKVLSVLIEFWLWLQFALVLGVVLFSMARMGPKSFFKPAAAAKNR